MKASEEHSDAQFYEMAMEEVQTGRLNRGLMTKSLTKSNGDKKAAEALYLEWRVQLLQEEQNDNLSALKLRQKKPFLLWFFAAAYLAFTVIVMADSSPGSGDRDSSYMFMCNCVIIITGILVVKLNMSKAKIVCYAAAFIQMIILGAMLMMQNGDWEIVTGINVLIAFIFLSVGIYFEKYSFSRI